MEQVSQDLFFSITKSFEIVPYSQSKSYLKMLYRDTSNKVAFFVDDVTHPKIACYGHKKKSLGITMILIEGESYKKF
jgi:hypothetical protein